MASTTAAPVKPPAASTAPTIPERAPQPRRRATTWIATPVPRVRAEATPGTQGPACAPPTRPASTTIGTVTDANTHSAIGRERNSAAATLRPPGVVAGPASSAAVAPCCGGPARTAAATALSDSTTVSANGAAKARSPEANWAISPETSGPQANPAVRTAPATVVPRRPRRSPAQAVPALIVSPTPRPTTRRPV
nr:hypothetical protein [Nocardioides sambongensis]